MFPLIYQSASQAHACTYVIYTGISVQNFIHSTIIAPLRQNYTIPSCRSGKYQGNMYVSAQNVNKGLNFHLIQLGKKKVPIKQGKVT